MNAAPFGQTVAGVESLVRRMLDLAPSLDEGLHRVSQLVAAGGAVTEDLDLSAALQRIVAVARELVGARYGALGVIGVDGRLERFLHDGLSDDQVRKLGEPPTGHGLLGAVITEGKSIRLDRIDTDSRSVGFPDHHPPMDSFLGVPIPVQGSVYGNLYLTEREGGPFDEVDEEIIATLAAIAGSAIANSRTFERSQHDRAWLEGAEHLSQNILGGEVHDSETAAIAAEVERLSGAPYVVCVDAAVDAPAERLADEALRALAPEHELGPVIVLPLQGAAAEPSGAVAIGRGSRGRPYSESERRRMERFARSIGIARELARARVDEQRVALADERDRIARDLHDHVIQSLFAVGLTLQSAVGDPTTPTGARIASQVDAIDSTIRQIRQAIYRLSAPPSANAYSLRARINTLVRETLDDEQLVSRLEFAGPVDTLVDTQLGDEVAAVLREALSNVMRHAGATTVEASVALRGAEVVVTVRDDGSGIPEGGRRSGLANLAARARERGGHFETENVSPHGTLVRWSVPWEAR